MKQIRTRIFCMNFNNFRLGNTPIYEYITHQPIPYGGYIEIPLQNPQINYPDDYRFLVHPQYHLQNQQSAIETLKKESKSHKIFERRAKNQKLSSNIHI